MKSQLIQQIDMKITLKCISLCLIFFSAVVNSQTLSAIQQQNARATGYAIVAAKNPGKSFSILMIKWDGINDLEYNANNQINPGWHPQAVVKGNYFDQTFNNSDFSNYSTVILSQSEFNKYKHTGADWWIVCSTLPSFSNINLSISDNGNVGIGTNNPQAKFQVGDFNSNGISKISIPGVYNFEEMRLGQYGNGANGLEMITHTNEVNSFGVRLFAGTDTGSNGLLIQTANPASSLHDLIYTTKLAVNMNGNVGIGTTSPAHKLDVIGSIRSREIKVDMSGADFVFEEKYPLMPLSDLETYIKKNKHLPEIAPAKEMQEQGSNLGDLNTKLLQKIEELTLYVIDIKKENETLKQKYEHLEKRLKKQNK